MDLRCLRTYSNNTMTPMDRTMSDIERSARLVQQHAPGCYVPLSSGGTHVTLSDVIQPVLDNLIATIEAQQSQQPTTTAPQKPVTCELITCIEAGVCDCYEPFKAITVPGRKWATDGCRMAQTKVHSATWQREHDPDLQLPGVAAATQDAPSLTSIEDQWNARAKVGWKYSGERGAKRPKKRTRRLPQQSNKLSFPGLPVEGELHVSGVGVGPKHGWCEQCQRVLPRSELHGVYTRILCERCH
jgi:hypothetical protein